MCDRYFNTWWWYEFTVQLYSTDKHISNINYCVYALKFLLQSRKVLQGKKYNWNDAQRHLLMDTSNGEEVISFRSPVDLCYIGP